MLSDPLSIRVINVDPVISRSYCAAADVRGFIGYVDGGSWGDSNQSLSVRVEPDRLGNDCVLSVLDDVSSATLQHDDEPRARSWLPYQCLKIGLEWSGAGGRAQSQP